MENKSNVTKINTGLENSPDAYVISVHIQNLMATFGQDYTLDVIQELFLNSAKPKKSRKAK